MVNRAILEGKLLEKFKSLTLHSVVNEAFITALPFKKEDMDMSDVRALSRYSLTVLEAVGGYQRAVEAVNTLKDIKHKAFLTDVINTCNSAALEAAKRVIANTDCKNTTSTVDEIVDAAAFTNEEYKKFKAAGDNIDTAEIGKIINDKTIAVIKSEKEIQEQDADLKAQLSDALAESSDFKNVGLESYLDIVLGANSIRTPATFFTKVFEASLENLMYSTESYNEIPFETLNKITFESTLNIFKRDKTPMECLESLISINCNPNAVDEIGRQRQLDSAMICSIIIYTVLEVLRTLHIYSPTTKDIEGFIKNTPSCQDLIAKDRDTFIASAVGNIDGVRRYCAMNNNNPQILSDARNTLLTMKEKIENSSYGSGDSVFLNARSDIMASIDSAIEDVSGRLSQAEAGLSPAQLSVYDKRLVDTDIAQFNRMESLFCKNTQIVNVCLMFDPNKQPLDFIDVVCTDTSGVTIAKSFFELAYKNQHPEAYLKECFSASKLASCNKSVFLCYNDGTGKKIQLK